MTLALTGSFTQIHSIPFWDIQPRDVGFPFDRACSPPTTMATPVLQRPYRGSRVSSFYPVKSLPPLASLDSAFQLQEYISLLIRRDVHDVDAIVALPGKASSKDHEDTLDSSDIDAKKAEDGDRKSDISVDKACWIYEQLRSVDRACIRVPSALIVV